MKVLNLLEEFNLDTLYTNKFIKDGVTFDKINFNKPHNELELIEP